MKRATLRCAILVALAIGTVVPAARAQRAYTHDETLEGALLHCDTTSHNFGEVNRREGDIRHTFSIMNRGDEPLIITNIVSSCSCMKHSISRKPIAPGEIRALTITYELKKMPLGSFSKSVMIYSTSRDSLPMSITLSGRSSYTTRREYKYGVTP